jgi:hypothetical protein
MTAAAWLAAVARRGGTCHLVDEGRRVWVSPRTALTPALREAFPDLKPLVATLVGCGHVTRSLTPGARTVPCPGCGRALPAARRTDRDFTVCVCCKLDAPGVRVAHGTSGNGGPDGR